MLDLTKPVQTRSGQPARILATDLKGEGRPIVAAVTDKDGVEALYSYRADGTRGSYVSDRFALVNAPETLPEYVNLVWASTSEGAARGQGTKGRILKLVREGDRIISAEVVPEENSNDK